nr:hypothetical protein [uncultured Undibacterium sp.]
MRIAKVFVHNRDGVGQSGYKVKTYNGDTVRTDRDGIADLLINDSGTISIYVNGREAFSGQASRLPKILTFQVS